jgi:sorting nexin-9/18/33
MPLYRPFAPTPQKGKGNKLVTNCGRCEQVLNRLRTARRTFEPPIYPNLTSDTRQQSIYERDLEHPRLNPDPLPQPCPHVFDATSMRPVSHAIQEGVGLLLGSAAGAVTGRGSILGKFW